MSKLKVLLVLIVLLFTSSNAAPQQLPPTVSIPGYANRHVASSWYIQRGNVGWHLWQYVKDGSDNVFATGFSCPHGTCISPDQFALQLNTAFTSADPITAFKNLWTSNISFTCDAPAAGTQTDLCNERRSLVSSNLPLALQNHNIYRVTGPAGATTMPAYSLTISTSTDINVVNTLILGTTVLEQVPVGTLCDIRYLHMSSLGGFYASYGATPTTGKVVQCQLAAQ